MYHYLQIGFSADVMQLMAEVTLLFLMVMGQFSLYSYYLPSPRNAPPNVCTDVGIIAEMIVVSTSSF
jgi:hypothetical protein